MIDLGFTEAHLPAGTHICQIYSEDKERDTSLLKFLLRGLQLNEANACFSENVSPDTIKSYFAEHGISMDEAQKKSALTLGKTTEVYFKDNVFNPERMLSLLEQFHEKAMTDGYSAARVIGDMSPEISRVSGGSRLLEYESKVSLLLRTHPITTVCQYDARAFDGAMILDVLKVHPMMVVRGAVVQNPFFVPPEEVLGQS